VVDAIGQHLRAAREKKRISLSQAAAKTHIKIQHIEALEREDFGRIPAPTYVKGFIRMYAEFLDIDAAPLVKAYVDHHAPKGRSSIIPDNSSPPAADTPSSPRAWPWRAWLAQARALLVKVPWRRIGVAVAIALTLSVAVVGLSRWVSKARQQRAETTVVEAPKPLRRTPLAIAQEPREPYVDITASAGTP
jgi:cytoskeletal protein RodZ